ncbi:U-box domain-containing protein 33 [Aristolochia californica]|uniref:U-box domain-containing protein 33 n=1 Tax=Aristolochia californica TaxID=171875 RepID=UPI0035DF5B85
MALVSSLPIQQFGIWPKKNIRYGVEMVRPVMASSSRVIEDEQPAPAEDMIFVAVGKEVKDTGLTLLWALENGGGKKIGLLHVHQPAQMIPLLGGKFSAERLKLKQVQAYRQQERAKMQEALRKYQNICATEKVQVEEFVIEMDDIARGILELVARHGVSRLVMGAAADKHYSKKMRVPKSKKAIVVSKEAPPSCQIWFICKGSLICTRETSLDGSGVFVTPPSPVIVPKPNIQPTSLKSRTARLYREFSLTTPDYSSLLRSKTYSGSSSPGEKEIAQTDPSSQLGNLGFVNAWKRKLLDSPSQRPDKSIWSLSDDGAGVSVSGSMVRDEESDKGSVLTPVHQIQMSTGFSSPLDPPKFDKVFDLLKESMMEAESSRREVIEESIRRAKAEKLSLDTMHKARQAEKSYNKALKQRKEAEDILGQEVFNLENIKAQHDEVMKELLNAREQQATLESQVTDSNKIVKELEGSLSEAQQDLETLKREFHDLQRERDEAIREAEELHRSNEESCSSSGGPHDFSLFSFFEIKEATQGFDPSLKIGEGGYGSVYRGLLRHTRVAVKVLNSESLQGRAEFEQEVDILSRVRHPNLVTLIGTCPEAWSLIYEYLPNGSLEDRLTCKDNSPPLSWQVRTQILADICSALLFLHSNKPHNIVHGDLKPANILLDSNFAAKVSDFGISRFILRNDQNCSTTVGWNTDPKGTFAYIDPMFQSTGILTRKSDVYSFGVIILRILTGRPALGIVKQVKEALERGNLDRVVDELAGDWPYFQANQLALLGLRCCEMDRKERPDLESDVLRVIEPMKAMLGSKTPSSPTGFDDLNRPPQYFFCPIFQEIMQDPHIAADGYTYEAEAIKGWLESGQDTSPTTNLRLAHQELIPNHALRSAIQEWLQGR